MNFYFEQRIKIAQGVNLIEHNNYRTFIKTEKILKKHQEKIFNKMFNNEFLNESHCPRYWRKTKNNLLDRKLIESDAYPEGGMGEQTPVWKNYLKLLWFF